MYDVPSSPMQLNSNILVNIQKALDEGTTIKAATHEYRGVTNVWEVVRNMEQTLELPGGIYNYGSGNHIDSYTLFLKVANIMGAKEPSTFILPDEERFSEQTRNLTMKCSLINNFGIRFNDSVEGIKKALMNRKP